MNYRILSNHLWPTAEAAIQFFSKEWGVTSFKGEEPIHVGISYRPTISAQTQDHCYLCIEVSESAYPVPLDSFVLDCKNAGLPVKLFVAMPRGHIDPRYYENSRRAMNSGVGLLQVDDQMGEIVYGALPLSITGCRRISKGDFPAKYRTALSDAEYTFKNGNPVKGCAVIFDEIESLCRKIAKKIAAKGLWRPLKAGEKFPKVNLETGAWQRVMELLLNYLDYKNCNCPRLDMPLIARVIGIIPHRNDSGHKVKTIKAAIKRDSELRTRFEHATDLLSDLIKASKPLHI